MRQHLSRLILILTLSTNALALLANPAATAATSSTSASLAQITTATTATALTTSANPITATTPTTPAAVTTPLTSTASTTTLAPTLVFGPIQTLTACGSAQISWRILNEDPTAYNINLRLLNGGVNQSIPPASSTNPSISAASSTSVIATSTRPTVVATISATTAIPATTTTTAGLPATPITSAASSSASSNPLVGLAMFVDDSLSKRTSSNVNQTFAPTHANVSYSMKISVPQGRYYILGSINDLHGTTGQSAVFSVIQGNDTSCLSSQTPATSSSESTSSTATGSTASSGMSSGSNAENRKGNGISGGAMAGAVVGSLAGLAVFGLLAFLCLRRRRRNRETNRDGPEMSQNRSRIAMIGGMGRRGHAQMPSGGTSLEGTPHTPRSPMETSAMALSGGNESGAEATTNGKPPVEGFPGLPAVPNQTTASSSHSGQNPFTTANASISGAPHKNAMTEFSPGPSDRDHRRYSSQTTPPTSLDQRPRSDSYNVPAIGRSEPSSNSLGRRGSTKRKPVPSFGPEFRAEAEAEMQRPMSLTGTEERRKSYLIVPDRPLDLGE